MGWGLHKELFDGLVERPGLFTMQETALLGYLIHKQYAAFATTKQAYEHLAGLWSVTPEYIRQLAVKLERKRALARLAKQGRKQEFAVTLPHAFTWYDRRKEEAEVPNPSWGGTQPGLGGYPTGVGPRGGSCSFDLSDPVPESTAEPWTPPVSTQSDTPLFDGIPLQTKPRDQRHDRLLTAQQDVVRKLRARIIGLIKYLLDNPTVAAEFNGGGPIDTETALDHALRRLCAKRRVHGWDEPQHLRDILVPMVAREWFKHKHRDVLEGRAPRPGRARRRAQR